MGGLVINTANGVQKDVHHLAKAAEGQQNGFSTVKKRKKRGRKGRKKNGAVGGGGGEDANGEGHEESPTDEGEGSEGGDGKAVHGSDLNGSDTNGHAVTDIPEKPVDQPVMSADDWEDGPEDIPVSMDQLVNGAKEPLDEEHDRQAIANWVNNKDDDHAYRCLTNTHRELLIDYIFNIKYPTADPHWASTIRQVFWRAIIRTSYFWTNPDTGVTGARPKPVHRPDGIYENDMRVWLLCAAERADRIGRDLPTSDYVERVEREVRTFLQRAELKNWWELQCLGFLLMFDEEYKHTLSLDHVQERIRKAFRSARFDWKGCEMFKPGPGIGSTPIASLNTAMRVWEEAQRFA